jgi:hypothetical protein
MGYSIDVSFDVLNTSSATSLPATIKGLAEECGCDMFYEDYEFEPVSQFKRSHCILTSTFSQPGMQYLLKFIASIVKTGGLALEVIYDEDANSILYASEYYITHKMNKLNAKTFKQERRARSYSDDENMILSAIKKHKS